MKFYTWIATFEYLGERPMVEIYNRENQPGEFEFVQLMNERMRNRTNYDPSRLRLLRIERR